MHSRPKLECRNRLGKASVYTLDRSIGVPSLTKTPSNDALGTVDALSTESQSAEFSGV